MRTTDLPDLPLNRGRALIAWIALAFVCWAVIGGVGIVIYALLDP